MEAEFRYIVTKEQLDDFCQEVSASPIIAFDTEFVSEDRYQPELCLIQVAAAGQLAVIDSLQINDTSAFWKMLTVGDHCTVAHAAREEFRFCKLFSGRRPRNLFDTQLGAGFVGLEYPAAYSTLSKVLVGETLGKGETRTNWRKRPLTQQQLAYALDDVRWLTEIYQAISDRLEEMNRWRWMQEETQHQQREFERQEGSEWWRRLAGSTNLSPRDLAIIREIWQWRDNEAQRANMPARRMLRDDLVVELAKRRSSTVSDIKSIRGMEFGRLQKHLPAIAEAIRTAKSLPKDELPEKTVSPRLPNLGLLGQFLNTALGVICREASIAPGLVGTTQDLRTLAAERLRLVSSKLSPRLATGWRREVVGDEIDRLLAGETALRIVDPKSELPLRIESAKH